MSNPEQLAFIESPLTDGVLIGIPGGGKTRSILERILYLRREGKIPSENGFYGSYLFTSGVCRFHEERSRGVRTGKGDP